MTIATARQPGSDWTAIEDWADEIACGLAGEHMAINSTAR